MDGWADRRVDGWALQMQELILCEMLHMKLGNSHALALGRAESPPPLPPSGAKVPMKC